MKTYKSLEIWKLAVEFTVDVYKLTNNLPESEKNGLLSQIRRSVISIPSNIAEGNGRNTIRENIYFLSIALGSLSELETQLIICEQLSFLNLSNEPEKINLIRAKILNYIKFLKGRIDDKKKAS